MREQDAADFGRPALGEALRFPISAPGWRKKLAVFLLLGLVPLLNLAQTGYAVEAIRRVALRSNEELPGWRELGAFFRVGLLVLLAQLVWGFFAGLMFAALFAGALLVPQGSRNEEALSSLVGYLPLVAVLLVTPGILARYAVTGKWRESFHAHGIVRYFRRNVLVYVLTLVALLPQSSLLFTLGSGDLSQSQRLADRLGVSVAGGAFLVFGITLLLYSVAIWFTQMAASHLLGRSLRDSPELQLERATATGLASPD